MEGVGQTTQDRLVGVGGNALDHQLVPRDAECERLAILEDAFGAPKDSCDSGLERRMPVRVDRVVM